MTNTLINHFSYRRVLFDDLYMILHYNTHRISYLIKFSYLYNEIDFTIFNTLKYKLINSHYVVRRPKNNPGRFNLILTWLILNQLILNNINHSHRKIIPKALI